MSLFMHIMCMWCSVLLCGAAALTLLTVLLAILTIYIIYEW